MTMEVTPVGPERATTLRNLMSLYLYEMSDLAPSHPDDEGRFRYPGLDRYFSESGHSAPGHYAFLIHWQGKLAGFALVMERTLVDPGEPGHVIAEFFVLRQYRRHHVGEEAARTLFDRFKGAWWVGELEGNQAALAFWRAVIGHYTHGAYVEAPCDGGAGQRAIAQRFTCAEEPQSLGVG